MKNLYLFDIDGTLVNINHVHLNSYKLDYNAVLGCDVSDELIVSTFGMTEADMHKFILKQLNIRDDSNLIRRLIEGHPSNFERSIESADVTPLEGVLDFLSDLRREKDYISVVTGNLEEPAKLILGKSGLLKHFDYINVDDGNSKRIEIVSRAVDIARDREYDFRKVVVIDDTTYGIEAGKHVNAYTVGVATGSESLGKLKKANPNMLLPNLTEYKKIMDAVK